MNEIATLTATIVATYDDGRTETLEVNLVQAEDGKRPEVIMHTANEWSEPEDWFPDYPAPRRHLRYTDVTIITGRVDPITGTWGRHTTKEAPPRGWRRCTAALRELRYRVAQLVRREAAE